jgi:NDP-sugar pyrophosphorylase family protein
MDHHRAVAAEPGCRLRRIAALELSRSAWSMFIRARVTDMITTAFVLGAGLGTRFRPVTDSVPKPLVPVFHKPLITFALDHLISVGIKSFVINTHRLAEYFSELFGAGEYAGVPVRLTHEAELLETGGGIKNAELLLAGGPFVSYSGDILADVDLQLLIDEHSRRGNDVTLAVRRTGLAAAIAVRDGRVIDIANRYGTPGQFDFANIAVWNPPIFARLPPRKKISFIPVITDWIANGGKIGAAELAGGKWFNVGSAADYLQAHRNILDQGWRPAFLRDANWPQQIHSTARVAPGARILGCSAVGPNCRVGEGVTLEDTILWAGAQIASRSHLSRCIVRSHQTISGTHNDAVL